MNCIKVPSFKNDLSDFLRESGGVENFIRNLVHFLLFS